MRKERKPDAGDRISELPDEVLCHILSFLPSNEAIATCLLSTRWRSLWTMVPALDFVCTPPITILKAQDKVDKFLSLRRTQRITRFHLKCNKMHEHCSFFVNELVSKAIVGKVEQINISLCPCHRNFFFSMPTRLFTCTTIVTLKLKGGFVLYVPSTVHLPSLKNLHLDVEKCYPSCKAILSGSPVLEVFYLKHKWALWFEHWKIVRNSRGNLLVANKPFLDLVIQSDGSYDFIHDYSVGHWENLVKVKVYMTVHDLEEEEISKNIALYPYVVRLLKMLRNVEFLSLCDLTEKMKGPSTLDLPQFQNLVQLELCVRSDHSLFLKLPEKCPKLQVLEFNVKDQK